MAYSHRGRGPKAWGGYSRGNFSGNMGARYVRRDSNRFSCLMDQDGGGGEWDEQFDIGEIFSDSEGVSNANEWTRREKKRKYNSSSSGPSQLSVGQDEDIDYSTLDTDEKINLILSKVTLNESRFQSMEKMFDKVYTHGKKLSEMSSVMVSQEERMRLLEYKSIELESRSRRNNVLFYGLQESRQSRQMQDCKRMLCEFLSEEMGITVNESVMSRAHRLGRYNQSKTRPIIAAFQDFNIAEKIIKNGHILREYVYSVSRDYPVEITRARKTLWPQYKRLKQENPLSKVAIVYPAKLIMNGKLVADMFPEWDDILRGSRIDLGHPSQQAYASKFGSTTMPPTTMTNEAHQRLSNGSRPNQDIVTNPDSDNYMEVANEGTSEHPRPEQVISDASSNQDEISQQGAGAGNMQNMQNITSNTSSGSSNSNPAAQSAGSGFKTPSSTGNPISRSLSQGRSRSQSRGGGRPTSRSISRNRLKTGDTVSGTPEGHTQTENSA